MSKKIKLLVIVGTTRSGRSGRKIADWYIGQAKAVAPENVELELFDVADYNLPVFNKAVPPMMQQYSDLQNKLAEKIGASDGFVFVTGEYNHSVPGSLKNFLDYIGAEWAHKPAGYVGYGTNGGVRAIEHLIQIMTELRVASVAKSFDNITIRMPWEALDENGEPKPEYLSGDIAKQLEELVWWAKALKTAREP
jgi:NAD(P)H-dependent FMN reductase